MLALSIISLAIFAIYLFTVLKYIGHVPQSLSETFYLLPSGLTQYIFTFVMWAIGGLLIAPMISVTPDGGQFMAFLAIAGIMFVGAAPMFKKEFEGRVHTVSAVIAAIFGIGWAVLFADGIYMLVISAFVCLVAALITKTIISSKTFWLEMVAFGTVYLSTILSLL